MKKQQKRLRLAWRLIEVIILSAITVVLIIHMVNNVSSTPGGWTTPDAVVENCGEEAGIGYDASKAIDGDIGTSWWHDSAENHYISFDFDSSKRITRIRLYQSSSGVERWGGDAGITVWVSDNTDNWGDNVWQGALDASGWQHNHYPFDATGQYVKLQSWASGVEERMHEFQVYVYEAASVTTGNAINFTGTQATLVSTVDLGMFGSVEACFGYRDNTAGENWELSNYYYTAPANPADVGEWGNRTPVLYIAATDSSDEDKTFVAAQGENGYQCSGGHDEAELSSAIDNLENVGGGKIYLFDGTYEVYPVPHDYGIEIGGSNITFVGESRDNTFIHDDKAGGLKYILRVLDNCPTDNVENILIENFTILGQEENVANAEHNGLFVGGTRSIVVRNVTIKNVVQGGPGWGAIGLYVEGGAPAEAIISDVWLVNNRIENTGTGGITVHDDALGTIENIYILNNTVLGGGMGNQYGAGPGIHIISVENLVIANNIVENSGSSGIQFSSELSNVSDNILVQGNLIVNSGISWGAPVAGIRLTGESTMLITTDVNIVGNMFIDNLNDNQYYGVEFQTANPYIENCTVVNNWFEVSVNVHAEGIGHDIDNESEPFANLTAWENISTTGYSKVLGSLTIYDNYDFKAKVKFDSSGEGKTIITGDVSSFTFLVYPTKPALLQPADGSSTNDNTPYFEWEMAEDADNHRILVDDNPDFSSPAENELLDADAESHTCSVELAADNYSWKIIAVGEIADNESDTWTFLVTTPPESNVYPNPPTALRCNGQTNPMQLTNPFPELSAVGTDNDGDMMTEYNLQGDDDSNFQTPVYTSGKTDITDFVNNTRCENIQYLGGISRGVDYWWRIKFWDNNDNEGEWSTETATFKMNALPTIPSNWTDLGTDVTDFTPTIEWQKGTDANGGDTVTTYVYVGTNSIPTTIETFTTDNTCELGSTVTLAEGGTYYYRLRSWDGLEWSTLYTTSDQFKMTGGEAPPSPPPLPDIIVEDEGGQLLMIHPIADVPVYQGAPDQNFGHQSVALVQYVPDYPARWWTYVKYRVPENILTQDKFAIKNIRISASVYGAHVTPEVYLYETSSDWSEDTITWNNKPDLGDFVVNLSANWDEEFDNYEKIYASLDNYDFTAGEVSFVFTANENIPEYKTYYLSFLTKEAGQFGTIEFVYVRVYATSPALVSIALLFTLMFAGFGVYRKLHDIHNLDTLIDGFVFLLYLSILVLTAVVLAWSFIG